MISADRIDGLLFSSIRLSLYYVTSDIVVISKLFKFSGEKSKKLVTALVSVRLTFIFRH